MTEPLSQQTTTDGLRAQLDQRLAECARHAATGVTIVDPATTYIDAGAAIGAGTVIEPNTTIRGETAIGRDCKIGPNSVLENASIGDRCVVFASVVRDSRMGDGSDIGPFGHLRGGTQIGADVHLGHSVEINRSRIGRGTKAAHFCYLADAEVGENVNIGAGAVTCNYDGEAKHKTVIEDGAFVGSDTMLVAPVRIGKDAATGAGAVVREDVPDGGRVAGVPARALGRDQQ